MTTQPAHVPTDTPLSSSPRASSRALVLLALLGALLQTLGGVLETLDRVEAGSPGFGFRTVLIGLAYLCLLGAVIELRRSTTAGRGRVVRVALMVAGAGWVLSAVAQLVLNIDSDVAEKALFPIATIAIGAGMLVVGIDVLRARRWSAWRRWVPLVCGVYPFVAIFPSFAAAGQPNFPVLTGWGLCWLFLAVALWPREQN
ncbi:hypothetical protein [Gordonia sp. (in: high G+C Gram-positive bacteria)]|jgi:hypothetical protein|uniref:hypothetical protein n=1 Tax=Gordonia sp. (in: high G+C Gram-positive bacteria) TaxID=84139 RepID=UPI001DF6F0F2|nr:hypothetical protein [Gordonia sp. (in: high G+C Gram-positive bacteria)]MCB1294903.1 hypothetical protein [Gordonia sp. (in: high G+C Gram-positive bacteria)]HMS73885.1 hypothetical protein [Gordonia sp. (in: high G+C Gram-positive bacteria)]HQV18645.1 hypothetical protein [Gordonia sp. (in: high G+C Gram-positive bacteria)]